jgi:hypothetical protein
MTNVIRWSVTLPLLAILAGCSGLSVFKDNDKAPQASTQLEPAPELSARRPTTPAEQPPRPSLAPEANLNEPEPSVSVMPAAKVRAAVAGKTFRWVGPNNSGTTIFAQDGKTLIEVDGRGTTSGKWVARDGQLCESINPGGTIKPEGSAMKCNPFSGGNGNYKVGAATFKPS